MVDERSAQTHADHPPGPEPRPVRGRGLVATLALAAAAAAMLSLGALRADGQQTGILSAARLAANQSLLPVEQPAAQPALALPGASRGSADLAQPAAAAQPLAAATQHVMIMNYTFSPASMSVHVGDTVLWTNQDTVPHTVTVSSGPAKFNSATLQNGQTFSYKFTKAGTYSYYCSVHPDMKATITVTGTAPPAAGPPAGSPSAPPASTTTCDALNSTINALLQHIYAAHLQEGPVQQLTDLLAIDQYTKTHTVLLENMLQPLLNAEAGSC